MVSVVDYAVAALVYFGLVIALAVGSIVYMVARMKRGRWYAELAKTKGFPIPIVIHIMWGFIVVSTGYVGFRLATTPAAYASDCGVAALFLWWFSVFFFGLFIFGTFASENLLFGIVTYALGLLCEATWYGLLIYITFTVPLLPSAFMFGYATVHLVLVTASFITLVVLRSHQEKLGRRYERGGGDNDDDDVL
jgi:hypothetical protein